MSLDIEPIGFIKRTALKERNEIIAKVNEIIDVINQAPQGLTIVEANLSLTSESTFEGTLTEEQFNALTGANTILKAVVVATERTFEFFDINRAIRITPGETDNKVIFGAMAAMDGYVAVYSIYKGETDYILSGELKEYATVEMVEAIEDELGSAEQPGTIRGDIAANDAAAVHKTGDETIGGNKTFSNNLLIHKSTPLILIKNNNLTDKTSRNSGYSAVAFRYANDETIGQLQISVATDGTHTIFLGVNSETGSPARIVLAKQADNIAYATCPARTYAAANTTDIVNNSNLEHRLEQLTKASVGLGNVDNTSDADKPISTAQREEFNNAFDDIRYLDDNKQTKLVSGVNIKTINNTDILGPGNIPISTVGTWGNIGGQIVDQDDLQEQFATKQDNLVSGSNIKTVGGQSLLGSGNIPIVMGGGYWKVPDNFNELTSHLNQTTNPRESVLCLKIEIDCNASAWTEEIPNNPTIVQSSYQTYVSIGSDFHCMIMSTNTTNYVTSLLIRPYDNTTFHLTPIAFNGANKRSGSQLFLTNENYSSYIDLSKCLIWVTE